jgi:hypothetical protein
MGITIEKKYSPAYEERKTTGSAWKKFIAWTDKQEEHKFGWTAFAIAGHGCVFTILTVMIILVTGNHFIFWPFAIGAMAAVLISNLAAAPTRITIPILFFSLLIDIAIIAICIVNGFDFEAMYV